MRAPLTRWGSRAPALAARLPRGTWAAVLLAALLAVVVTFADSREQSQWALFIGRFHPLLVHLPIGGLLVAALLAALSRTARFASARAALLPVLACCAVSGVLSVAAGQLLGSGGAYGGGTFFWHRTLGYVVVIVAIGATVSLWAESTARDPRIRFASDAMVGMAVVVLMGAGYLGGTLAHGPGYLTESMPRALRAWVPGAAAADRPTGPARPQQIVAYEALVRPILEARCVSCHGPDKVSGGLRLDTPEHIEAGGSSGLVVRAGQADNSDMIRRIWLPVTHRDVMPPKERAPITVAEASLLRWWVDQGAPFDRTLADLEVAADVKPAIEARVGTLPLGAPATLPVDVPSIDPSALAGVLGRGLPVSRLAEDASLLQIQGRAMGRAFGDAEVEALLPVAAHVTWLDLGGTAVTDVALPAIARFPHLHRLHLDRTAVTDAGLQALRGLAHLEYMNLYATAVTDAGVAALRDLPRLRTVYLWQTRVTDAGLSVLRAAHPALRIDTGAREEPSDP